KINTDIDVKADFRFANVFLGALFGFRNFDPTRAPLAMGDVPKGLDVQTSFVKLLSPGGNGLPSTRSRPTFEWTLSGREVRSTLYVSTFGPGQGLFAGDTKPEDARSTSPRLAFQTANGPDSNRNRIFSQEFSPVESNNDIYRFQLPPELTLTAGQPYWWGVEATTEDGQVHRKSASFRVDPVEATSTPYASVTLLTHGFEPAYINSSGSQQSIQDLVEMGKRIARQGGGAAFYYDPASGHWRAVDPTVTLQEARRKPLVLIADWAKEAGISDSGFAEAAADAIFASLVQLNSEQSGSIFASPMHLIGFSRGAVVNSEIAQRLGTYFPSTAAGGVRELQMTTLDPHDFKQASLDVPADKVLSIIERLVARAPELRPVLSKVAAMVSRAEASTGSKLLSYADFKDPDVETWSNITFHDNYYQTVANEIGNPGTLNGRSILTADINLSLNGRSGFTTDDSSTLGLGSSHERVKSWYAGTLDLAATDYPSQEAVAWAADRIWRKITDRTFKPDSSLDGLEAILSTYANVGVPWYRAHEAENGSVTLSESQAESDLTSWEGIGSGWFYSELGGGKSFRPSSGLNRVALSTDNTEQGAWDKPVPTIFNGNFQASMRPLFGRFPFDPTGNLADSWLEIPGCSLQGGNGDRAQGASYKAQFRVDWLNKLLDPLRSQFGNDKQFAFLKAAAALIARKVSNQILDGKRSSVLNNDRLTGVLVSLQRDLQALIDDSVGIGNPFNLINLVLEKLDATPARNALTGSQVVSDVTSALQGLIGLAETRFLDYSFVLSPESRGLAHNRLFIPADAKDLCFTMNVITSQPDAIVKVAIRTDSGEEFTLGNLQINASDASGLHNLAVPQ
ncbi:MAG: hypothetical protein ACKN89_16415, partial [Cyanobium sp.]